MTEEVMVAFEEYIERTDKIRVCIILYFNCKEVFFISMQVTNDVVFFVLGTYLLFRETLPSMF